MAKQDNTKKHKGLCKLLKKGGWVIVNTNIEQGVIVAFNEGKTVAFQLFYGDDKDHRWFAYEKNDVDDPPLWYADTAYINSPVHSLISALDGCAKKFNASSLIIVLMNGNYIVNAEDVVKDWKELKAKVITHCRLEQIINDKKLLTFKTSIKDISSTLLSESIIKNKTDEIDKQLEDFIDNMLKDFEEELSNSDKKQIVAEPQQAVVKKDEEPPYIPQIEGVCFSMIDPNDIADKPQTLRINHFRYKKGYILYTWVEFNEFRDLVKFADSNGDMFIEFRDSDNNTIHRSRMYINEDPYELISLGVSLNVGEFWCHIICNEQQIYTQKVTITDVTKTVTDIVAVDAMGIYHLMTQYTDKPLPALSCFNIDNLFGIYIVLHIRSKAEKPLEVPFIVKILDELGRVIFEDLAIGSFSGKSDAVQIDFRIEKEIRVLGRYIVRIELFEEAIAEAQIIIGHKDVETKYTPHAIRPKHRNFITTENTSYKDSTEELMGMVGLTRLKDQVKRLTSLAKVNKARLSVGLPVKKQQLHFAFLGNPGTGKTTVAKLLGDVYKDLGLLSKGHVVFRERSTLMTQNWGGEGDKVQEALEEARGGVLFIDEAYDLVTKNDKDPGQLIISALLTAMSDENNRDIMVIFAGYTQPMERLLTINEGLSSRLEKLYFDDYNAHELMQIASLWLVKNGYVLTKGAEDKLRLEIEMAYALRGENFGNGRYVFNLFEKQIQPAMAERVALSGADLTIDTLTTIEESDIPSHSKIDGVDDALEKLSSMVGLKTLKGQLDKHLSMMHFAAARRECNINTPTPPMHMIFAGNPGTGKTTVADYLGEIYSSMGLLSVGNVIKVSRADIVGEYIGETEKKMKNLLNAAHGNILFIDEAYTLFSESDDKDYGKKAIEVLLGALDRETCDFIVILAGYPDEMEKLIGSNAGLRGRFPYTFYFEDYNQQELMQIAEDVAERNNLVLSDDARRAILAVIRQAIKQRDESFSNARFVVRLLTTQVIPAMAQRLVGEKDAEQLKLVLAEDIPIDPERVDMIIDNTFDEDAIAQALARLDSLVGLTKVKSAIHSFVSFARSLGKKGEKSIENYSLKWSFVGNSGTGKSTVAQILSQILKAMHILGKGHTVELKAEELYNVPTHQAQMLVRERMQQSMQGLLFVDGDAPEFKSPQSNFNPNHLRMSLAASTSQIRGHFAVVIAEHDSPRVELARSLTHMGIYNFDHTLIFDDYTPVELLAVLEQCLEHDSLSLDDQAREIMQCYINRLERQYRSLYANARTMRLLATAICNQYIVDGCKDGIVTASALAEFATITPQRKTIGY